MVLVIEDDPYLRETLQLCLEALGYECKACGTVDDEIILKCSPTHIFLDYLLKEAVTKKQADSLKLITSTLILMSSSHRIEDAAKELEIKTILRKPFSIEELENILNL